MYRALLNCDGKSKIGVLSVKLTMPSCIEQLFTGIRSYCDRHRANWATIFNLDKKRRQMPLDFNELSPDCRSEFSRLELFLSVSFTK